MAESVIDGIVSPEAKGATRSPPFVAYPPGVWETGMGNRDSTVSLRLPVISV